MGCGAHRLCCWSLQAAETSQQCGSAVSVEGASTCIQFAYGSFMKLKNEVELKTVDVLHESISIHVARNPDQPPFLRRDWKLSIRSVILVKTILSEAM